MDNENPIVEINRAYRRVVDFCSDDELGGPVGATDSQIDALASAQGVAEVPIAVRQILRHIGMIEGVFAAQGTFCVSYLGPDAKEMAIEFVEELPRGVKSLDGPDNLLVVMKFQSECCLVVDGSDLGSENPPLWELSEDGRSPVRYSSTTTYFDIAADRACDYISWARRIDPRD
ncbi:hypothetical protein QX204_24755 [Nocardia sp. PE-7]|uniref:hypothetical protein n=1 Tax=Nocardia sp. PE-7 TaxID=3058426 RepID=UPI0026584C1A|nr:hypothetical protein [Nocardia sp. PE-7]WKG08253.1 hypothetical protein QX204_24755 [Nocardia sp. PE-7]